MLALWFVCPFSSVATSKFIYRVMNSNKPAAILVLRQKKFHEECIVWSSNMAAIHGTWTLRFSFIGPFQSQFVFRCACSGGSRKNSNFPPFCFSLKLLNQKKRRSTNSVPPFCFPLKLPNPKEKVYGFYAV